MAGDHDLQNGFHIFADGSYVANTPCAGAGIVIFNPADKSPLKKYCNPLTDPHTSVSAEIAAVAIGLDIIAPMLREYPPEERPAVFVNSDSFAVIYKIAAGGVGDWAKKGSDIQNTACRHLHDSLQELEKMNVRITATYHSRGDNKYMKLADDCAKKASQQAAEMVKKDGLTPPGVYLPAMALSL